MPRPSSECLLADQNKLLGYERWTISEKSFLVPGENLKDDCVTDPVFIIRVHDLVVHSPSSLTTLFPLVILEKERTSGSSSLRSTRGERSNMAQDTTGHTWHETPPMNSVGTGATLYQTDSKLPTPAEIAAESVLYNM